MFEMKSMIFDLIVLLPHFDYDCLQFLLFRGKFPFSNLSALTADINDLADVVVSDWPDTYLIPW
jgi:hypothetical protein